MNSDPYQSPTEIAAAELTRLERKNHGGRRSRAILIGVASLALALTFPLWIIRLAAGINSFVVAVACWAACPYLIICLAASRISSRAAKVLLALALGAIAAFGLWAFDKVDEDAQGGIILVFAPGYQLIGALLATILVLVVDKWSVQK